MSGIISQSRFLKTYDNTIVKYSPTQYDNIITMLFPKIGALFLANYRKSINKSVT